jgi:hypothetical protein
MDPIPEDRWCTCKPMVALAGKAYPPKQGEGIAQQETGYPGRQQQAQQLQL